MSEERDEGQAGPGGEGLGTRETEAAPGGERLGAQGTHAVPSDAGIRGAGAKPKKRAPLLGPTIFLALWCMAFWEIVLRKVGLRPVASYGSWVPWQELGRFAWPAALGAFAYQLVFRGWAREAGYFVRFLWTIFLPAALSAGVLAGAAWWMSR